MANTKITNHIVDKTLITGQTAVTAADGDYILVADASDSSALKKVLASDLIQTSEEVADIVGAMVSSNTESGITVAYQDADNTIDFTVGTLNQNTTGSAATLTTARTIGGTSFDGSANIAVGLAATATALATSRTIHGVGFDGSANIDLAEVIQDTVGAMVASNTETNITVTYQDADGTIDFVVDAAQPNVTSLGTLTALQVDNINLNGNTLTTTSSDFIVDASHDIILDADGGEIRFKDANTEILVIANKAGGGTVTLTSSVQDKDIQFVGNDGGSAVTALSLDMSLAGKGIFNAGASFQDHVYLGDDDKLILGGGDDLQIYHDGSHNYIKGATADQDIIFQGMDGSSAITAMTIDMSAAGMVGIGTTGPSAKLDVVTNDNVYTAEFTQSNTGNGDGVRIVIGSAAAADYAFDVRSDEGNTQSFVVKGDGKVGVGIAAPVTGLTVATSTNISQVALTSASTVTWNALTAANAMLVPGANLTIGNPSNPVEGAIISIEIAMNGTPRTIAWHANFEFAASETPVATATANKTDIFAFRYNGSQWQEIGRSQNMAQT